MITYRGFTEPRYEEFRLKRKISGFTEPSSD